MKFKGKSVVRYLCIGSGRRLSQLGEKLGLQCLIYNPLIFWDFHEGAMGNARGVGDAFENAFPDVQRIADVGSGSCAYAAELVRRGYFVQACEKSIVGRLWGKKQGVICKSFNLKSDPPTEVAGDFDLAYCFEVAEHLNENMGIKLVRFLSSLAPMIVFSAAQPGQEGIGHIFLKPQEYWIEEFEEFGKIYDNDLSRKVIEQFKAYGVNSEFLIRNCMVFRDNRAIDIGERSKDT